MAHSHIKKYYKINYLYYLVHMDNMSSICRHGLLSHARAHQQDLVQKDIADQEVIERRSRRELFGRPLHQYVPLYFTPKGPMLYKRREIQNDIVILCLNRNLLRQKGVAFSNGNAASQDTEFFNDLSDLGKLDWDCIRNEYWTDFEDGRRKRCSEVLVPDQIPFKKVKKVIVRTVKNSLKLDKILPFNSEIKTNWYFDD